MIEKERTHVLNTDMATQDVLPLINPISLKKASPPNSGSVERSSFPFVISIAFVCFYTDVPLAFLQRSNRDTA